jgi:Zn-dependent protease
MTSSSAQGEDLARQITAEIGDLFLVEDITSDYPQAGAVRFRGRLLVPAEDAYARLNQRLKPRSLVPVIRQSGQTDVLIVLPAAELSGVGTGRPWVNLVMFLATAVSVLLAGAQQSTGNLLADLLSGWPFAVGLLGILLTHEFGHYFAARAHGVAATLPYFIPFPLSILGTFGAVIQIKAPMRDRKAVLDIGAAGPLAGLIVALPVLLLGLSLSPVQPAGSCPPEMVCYLEGNSLLYAGAKLLMFGRFLPSGGEDVWLHPLASAGWAGLLVTAFNLLPIGTLDGGHVAYALLGQRARHLYFPLLLAVGGLGLVWNGWWLWAIMIFFFGRARAQPLDDTTPLGGRRKLIAVVACLVFVLTFTPLPITIIP